MKKMATAPFLSGAVRICIRALLCALIMSALFMMSMGCQVKTGGRMETGIGVYR